MFEEEATSDHLVNLLNCNLKDLPIEILSDEFFSDHGKSQSKYRKCLRKSSLEMRHACKCKLFLQQKCFFNGSVEISCFKRLHGTSDLNYNVNVTWELARKPEEYLEGDLQLHQKCLQSVNSRISRCLDDLIDVCKSSSRRATKVIRMHASTANRIISKDPEIMILHYVRDPRAIMDSRMRIQSQRHLTHSPSKLCMKMAADLRAFTNLAKQNPCNIMQIRYEDLVTDTATTLKHIYGFMGAEVPLSVVRFYTGALGGFDKEGSRMETVRKNGTATAYRWEKHLSKDVVKRIETDCGKVMKELKYPFQN